MAGAVRSIQLDSYEEELRRALYDHDIANMMGSVWVRVNSRYNAEAKIIMAPFIGISRYVMLIMEASGPHAGTFIMIRIDDHDEFHACGSALQLDGNPDLTEEQLIGAAFGDLIRFVE